MDYSKFEKIEVSDDEEDFELPKNINGQAFKKWRKDAKRREQEETAIKGVEIANLKKRRAETMDESEKKWIDSEISALELSLNNRSSILIQDVIIPKGNNVLEKQKKPSLDKKILEELAQLRTIEDVQKYVAKYPQVIGHQEIFDELFILIFARLNEESQDQGNKKGKEKESRAKEAVGIYLIFQYCQAADLGSGIYWVFRGLLNNGSEQHEEFEKELAERYNQLKKEFKETNSSKKKDDNSEANEQPDDSQLLEQSKKQIKTLAALPKNFREALTKQDDASLNAILKDMDVQEAERIMAMCEEANLLEFQNPKGETGSTMNHEAYAQTLKRSKFLEELPEPIRKTLQEQNIPAFLEELRKINYEEACNIIDKCISSKILKLENQTLEALKETLKPDSDPMIFQRMQLFHSLPLAVREAIQSGDPEAFQKSLSYMEPSKKREIFKKCEEAGLIKIKESENGNTISFFGLTSPYSISNFNLLLMIIILIALLWFSGFEVIWQLLFNPIQLIG